MQEAFFGRENETKQLNNFFNTDSFQAALIYGRRRVGKTELIKHCIQDKKNK